MAAVRCVQYDGKLIVSGAYDYMVKIWHPERQECLHTLQGHTNRVYSLQVTSNYIFKLIQKRGRVELLFYNCVNLICAI